MKHRLIILAMVCLHPLGLTELAVSQDAATDKGPGVHYLDQGWTDTERQGFYFVPQGSEIMPYSWFLALEQAGKEDLFREQEYLESFGFLRAKTEPANPAGLPVGFTKSSRPGEPELFGLTCAACHTSQMRYQDASIRVDGGTNLLDLIGFQVALDDAVRATLTHESKFQRFSDRLLGNKATDAQQKELRDELQKLSISMGNWRATSRPAHPTGFGHWDAVNILMNTINATALNEPSNYRVPQMPVSYPSIWLTSSSDKLLWNAAVSSVTLRQVGEVIIVFGKARARPTATGIRFDTSANLNSLHEVYKYVNKLKPPKWPEELLGPLDAKKVARGAELYVQEGCAKCHANKPPYPQSAPNSLGNRFIKTYPTPIGEVKTDPTYAEYFVKRSAKPGLMAPAFKGTFLEGQEEVPAAVLFLATLTALTESDLNKFAKTPEDRARLLGGRPLPTLPKTPKELDELVQSLLVYKAAPLPGIWASAPYLHNASVPNLYELLLPAEQRSKQFRLGNREFDTKRVGYRTDVGGYEYDTTLPAYSNQGHEYGVQLSDEDRWALVEYLKSL